MAIDEGEEFKKLSYLSQVSLTCILRKVHTSGKVGTPD